MSPATASKPPVAVRHVWGAVALPMALTALLAAIAASLAFGSVSIPLNRLVAIVIGQGSAADIMLVETLRAPRTLLGLLAGAGLGASGALMQSLTRSPLADPGLLGINAGAAAMIVAATALFGLHSLEWRLLFAFSGAAATMLVVYGIGARLSRASASTLPLVLAGIALTAALGGLTTIVMLSDPTVFDDMRHWSAGSLAIPDFTMPAAIAAPIAIGLLLAGLSGQSLDAMALGHETATGLGVNVLRLRAMILLSIALLCGAATAAAGPIGFVGLMVPHLARMLVGPDERRILMLSMLIAPALLLISDVVGRLLLRPAELQVGIVTAFVGAPVLVALARRRLDS